jgi:hypothetical protein
LFAGILAGYFTGIGPAHAVGDDVEPAMLRRFSRRTGFPPGYEIFIMITNQTLIRSREASIWPNTSIKVEFIPKQPG